MNQLYYIISSLPYLKYDMDQFPNSREFFDICKRGLNKKDLKILRSAKIFEIEREYIPNDVLKKWYSWESNIRNQLAWLRANEKNEDPAEYIKGDLDEIEIGKEVRQVFESDSPLIAENMLNKARWLFLEELEFGHYFDFDKLILYFLKLQILLRKKQFNKEKGAKKLNKIINDFSELDVDEIQKNTSSKE